MRVTDRIGGNTVENVRRALAAELKRAAVSSAELDARLLVGAVMGLNLTGMIASCRWLLSGKNEQASSLQFEPQDPDLGNSLSRKYRSLFLLQSRTGWEWDYPSANLSSEIMAAACGLNQTWTAAQSFNLLYPYATDETRLCRSG